MSSIKKSNGRKAVLADFLDNTDTLKFPNILQSNQHEKPKHYRIQNEYGEKKFIKPWRTGTKSQQLPPKGKFSKNKGNH